MRGVVLAAIVLLASACTRPNQGVCCTDPDDCRSIGASDSERPCSMGLVCTDHECQVPPPPPSGCQTDGDCSGGTPHCASDGTCVGCIDSSQCSGETPTCDAMTHQCRACTSDDDCDSGVCDLTAGTCTADAEVLYAAPAASDTADCSKATPCSATHAIALAAAPRNTVKLLPGNYVVSLSVSGKTVIIDGTGASLTAPSGMFPVDIGGNTLLQIEGLSIIDTNPDQATGGSAIHCAATVSGSLSVDLDRVSIDAQNTGIFASVGCTVNVSRSSVRVRTLDQFHATVFSAGTVTIDRSLFDGGDGINSFGTARVTNSVFTNETGPDGAFAGVGLGGTPGTVDVSFSTIINSNMLCVSGAPTCNGGSVAGSCVDNSLFFNNNAGAPANTLGNTSCVANFTLVFPQSTTPSGANNTIGINPQLKDPANGDYHLTANSPAVDAADPASTPTPDFDGTSRPQGTRSDMGAFELKQ